MVRKEISEKDVLTMIADMTDTFTPQQYDRLRQNITIVRYKKNEVIYHEGEAPRELMCLLSGKVKIYKDGVGGRSQIMRVIKPVEFFGFRAYFSNQPYLTGGAALESSIIAKVPLPMIAEMIRENGELGWFFIQRMAKAMGTSDERTVNLTQKHIRGRLAESILFLKDNYGVEEDGCTLSIYLSREDMANLSNMTTANAIRTLSSFANDKIIAIDGRKIKIMDQQQLERISKMG